MKSAIRILILLCFATLSGCGQGPGQLEEIKSRGLLRVASINGPTTIYEGPQGVMGLEHDLILLFAEHLGLLTEIHLADNEHQALEWLKAGKVDLVAAGLIINPSRKRQVRFGPGYQTIDQLLVYQNKAGLAVPKGLDALKAGHIELVPDAELETLLDALVRKLPGLSWSLNPDKSQEELIHRVAKSQSQYAIAASSLFSLARRHWPGLSAISLQQERQLAWAFPRQRDKSLLKEAEGFFARIEADGELAQLIERYYGHAKQLNLVDLMVFRRHCKERLPRFLAAFKYAALVTGTDWRLLAAISYQESHWDPDAISPTGVRGLMMLTQDTAKDLKLDDRTNPTQSIVGGARYFKQLEKRLPGQITEPDRGWFALAGYNVGFGHLQDARYLAMMEKRNPDKWAVIKEYLPRLSEKHWYEQTSYGYARGQEPVQYVDNIRSYYELLQRLDRDRQLPSIRALKAGDV
jgi:membrane-bound lytic murein transglycosylase F